MNSTNYPLNYRNAYRNLACWDKDYSNLTGPLGHIWDVITKRTKNKNAGLLAFGTMFLMFIGFLLWFILKALLTPPFDIYMKIPTIVALILVLSFAYGVDNSLKTMDIKTSEKIQAQRNERLEFIQNTPIPTILWQNQELRALNLSPEQKEAVNNALKDFFMLHAVHRRKPLSMPSKLVDKLWHAFILDTKRYEDYCEEAFGDFFHHIPDYEFSDRERNVLMFTWQESCRLQNIDPANPSTVPRLFAIEKIWWKVLLLAVPYGWHISKQWHKTMALGTPVSITMMLSAAMVSARPKAMWASPAMAIVVVGAMVVEVVVEVVVGVDAVVGIKSMLIMIYCLRCCFIKKDWLIKPIFFILEKQCSNKF